MARKFLFLDRDGTLIEEPDDQQVDSLDKVKFMPGVIPALVRLKSAGFEFVIVSNQDGLGKKEFPLESFQPAQDFVKTVFSSQGINFVEEFFCPHKSEDNCSCRKPNTGLVREFFKKVNVDREESVVVGDRDTDMLLAENLGIRGLRVSLTGKIHETWPEIARLLLDKPRQAKIERKTRETNIAIRVDLDSVQESQIDTGIKFFDHMLEQLGKHGAFELDIRCHGDLQVDEHHTVEDVALALGEALKKALGDKRNIERYGFLLPMDEAEAQVSIDLSARPYLVFEGEFTRERVGELPTELVPHFFRSLADSLGAAIHIQVIGENNHHMVESCFKGVARALREAFRRTGSGLPSTKGQL